MTDDGTALDKLYLEDLFVGQKFKSRALELTSEDIRTFGRAYDPQSFHIDEKAAETSFFNGLAASGWHTAALTMRLVVETLPLAGGLIGAGGEISWPQPTRPGDILEVEVEVLKIMPSRSRPRRGSAIMRNTTRNQRGEVLQSFTFRVLLERRVPGS